MNGCGRAVSVVRRYSTGARNDVFIVGKIRDTGYFLENDFWTPPPYYQICTWISYVTHDIIGHVAAAPGP